MGLRRLFGSLPPVLTLSMLYAALLGVTFVWSASYQIEDASFAGEAYKQVVWLGISLAVFGAAVSVSYKRFEGLSYLFYGGMLLVLLCVPFIVPEIKGARSWVRIGSVSWQPSELMKVAFVMALACYLTQHGTITRAAELLVPIALAMIPVGLILLQPDLGTASVFAPVLLAMLFAAGCPLRHVGLLVLLGLGTVAAGYPFLKGYQRDRILAFLDPESARLDVGWQLYQSKIAIGSGGILGKGWGSGLQNQLDYLPDKHTDFIFAVVAEEWGFVGAFSLLAAFLLLLAGGLDIALRTRDPYGRLLAVGCTAMIGVQATLNIFVVLGIVPTTGITLPFVSYGGSSLVSSFLLGGLIANVAVWHQPHLAGGREDDL